MYMYYRILVHAHTIYTLYFEKARYFHVKILVLVHLKFVCVLLNKLFSTVYSTAKNSPNTLYAQYIQEIIQCIILHTNTHTFTQ